MLKTELSYEKTINYFNDLFKGVPYFISGSYANPDLNHFNDIDIFFYSKEHHAKAKKILNDTNLVPYFTTTHCSDSTPLYIGNRYVIVQLVKKNFGTIQEIFNSFDLNVCKHVLLPTGKIVSDPSASKPLHITKPNSFTFKRLLKYLNYQKNKKCDPAHGTSTYYEAEEIFYLYGIINTYISNSDLVENYYQEEQKQQTVNSVMYKTFSAFPQIKDYLDEQALKYSPELLL